MHRLVLCLAAAALAAGVLSAAALAAGPGGPATVNMRQTKVGVILVDGKGRSLYLFEKDKHGKSTCSGACARAWPPLLTKGAPKATGGAVKADLGTTKRSDGTTQVTYHGHPLYTYFADMKVGQTNGEGSTAFGASWYVLNKSGNKIDKS